MSSIKKRSLPDQLSITTAIFPGDMIYHQAFANSIQPSIIITVSTGEIITANAAACKLLGYSKKELLVKNRSEIFNPRELSFKKMMEQRTAEGSSIAYVTVTKKNGKLLACEITSAVFTDSAGNEKSITTIASMSKRILEQRDIDKVKEQQVSNDIATAKSKQKKIDIKKERIVSDNIAIAKSKQKKIDIKKEKIAFDNILKALLEADALQLQNNEWIKNIGKTSYDVMWDWDVEAGSIYVGDSIVELFGCRKKNNTVLFSKFTNCLLPGEKENVQKRIAAAIDSKKNKWNDKFHVKRSDGSIALTVSRAIIVRDAEGKALHLIGAIKEEDSTELLQKKLDEQETLNSIHAEKIIETAKTDERMILGKELHDNVNQLLGASKLYLEMAKKKKGNKDMYLNRSREYTLMAIDEIRKLSKSLITDPDLPLQLGDSIKLIAHDIMEMAGIKVTVNITDFIEDSVPEKFRLNMLRIIQEQVNNILKHSKATAVSIDIVQAATKITLSITDNGVGFNTHQTEKGIGIANIKNRALYYNGTADFISLPGEGCNLLVMFPISNKGFKKD